eukprot:INCI12252.1.p1 GENE.INCI12252.1~~INCI12252.1.p1  ORF type:complete len:253 (+),score=42.48 INCI12252.1:187-945(+)
MAHESKEPPSWDDLWALPLEAVDRVMARILRSKPSVSPDRKDYPDCTYVSFQRYGVELCFDRDVSSGSTILGAIHLRPVSLTEQSASAVKSLLLPHGLKLNATGRSVVELLGEPTKKGGGGKVGGATPLFIVYEPLGLQISFAGRDWNDANVPVSEICFCKPPKPLKSKDTGNSRDSATSVKSLTTQSVCSAATTIHSHAATVPGLATRKEVQDSNISSSTSTVTSNEADASSILDRNSEMSDQSATDDKSS